LVAEIDAKLGGFGIVPDDLAGAIVSSHYFLFVVNEACLDRRFLSYFIRTAAFRDQVNAQGSTNYAAIRPEDVLRYTMPLPPLPEQRRIVARIEALGGRIDESKRLQCESQEQIHALERAETRRLFGAVANGSPVRLESVCTAIIDNLHSNPCYAEDGVPCVRSCDVGWGELLLDSARRTSEEEYRRRTVRGEPSPNDIVFVREGGGTGKAAIVGEGQRFSLGQRVMMLRPDPAKVLPRFLLYQLLSPSVYDDQVLPLCTGSASPHLNIGALKRFTLRCPPLSEQACLVDRLDSMRDRFLTLRALQSETAAELDALLPAVLSQAFAGNF
jgi:type I restriction enzyme S subunit